jgi:predicted hydrocarbon binding protein
VNDLNHIKKQLVLTDENRLVLGNVAMILMPAWFFSGILKRTVEKAGYDLAAQVYYDAGFDGAYQWGKVQIEAGLKGRQIMEQYLGSMTHRGWGRFEIMRLSKSAVALAHGPTDHPMCLWVPGALAGAMQVILDDAKRPAKVIAREQQCLSQEADYCEFVVEPARG